MTSVIIPAYNAEKYLKATIAGVISQSETDWEIILIDDGSTDGTPSLCDEAAASDSRIRAVHTPNRGVSAARNTGLELAKGQLIAFLDADDVLHKDFLKTLMSAMEENGAPIAAAPFRPFKGKVPHGSLKSGAACIRLTAAQALDSLFYQTCVPGSRYPLDTSIWGKLYRREIWDGVRFKEGSRFEDLEVFYKLVIKAGSVSFFTEPLIYYRVHGASFLQNYTPSRLDVLDVTDAMLESSRSSAGADVPAFNLSVRTRRFAAHCNIYLLLLRNRRPDRRAERRCLEVMRAERKMVLLNKKARFKDRAGALAAFFLFCFKT